MEAEPFEELAAYIEFDRAFYSERAKIAPHQAVAHFVQIGRFEARLVRAFSPLELAAAVQFDPRTYLNLHPDVRDAGVDPWGHFLEFGLKEFRVTAGTEVPEDDFWAELGVDSWRLLTHSQKIEQLDTLSTGRLAVAVRNSLHERGQVLYRSSLATLLAKASLVLGWPAVAAAFLTKHREALAFSVPDKVAPPDRVQVCEMMPLRSYCESRSLPYVTVDRANGSRNCSSGAGSIVACLPEAVVCLDGSIKTFDHVYLLDASWSGLEPPPRRAVMGPRHCALTLKRCKRRIPGTSVSLLRSGALGAVACIVDAFPRLLAAMDAGLPSNVTRPGNVSRLRESIAYAIARIRGSRGLAIASSSDSLDRNVLRARAQFRGVHRGVEERRSAPGRLGSVTCLVASQHAEMARTLLLKLKPSIGVELAMETTDTDLSAEALIVSGAPSNQSDSSSRPPFVDWLGRLRNSVAGQPSSLIGSGILLRSDSASASGIANGADLDRWVRSLGLERLAPNWCRSSELIAAVSSAPVLAVGSALDAAALIFARSGTPIVLLGLRAREFEAVCALVLAANASLHVVGGLVATEETQSHPAVVLINKVEVESELKLVFGDDVLAALLEKRSAGLVATVRAAPKHEAFDILQSEGNRLFQMSAAVGRSWVNADLDALCFEIGAQEWRSYLAGGRVRPRVRAYYATQLLRIGGHTRLIEDLIAARPDDEHHVICSALPDIELGWERDLVFRPDSSVALHLVPVNLNDRLSSTIAVLRKIRPATLYHLAHPDDPVGTAILHPDAAEQLILVHHNDHSFCFGPSRPGLVHLTLHARSKRTIERLLGLRTTCIPMTSQANEPLIRWDNGEPLLTVTSGSQGKFVSRDDQRYVDLLRTRLTAREGRHVHIGPLDPGFLHELERDLAVHGLGGRLLWIAFATNLAETLRTLRPQLYLNSYPVGGGRALVDAMALGLPIASGQYDANLDSSEVPYRGHVSWTHLGELQQLLLGFSEAERARHQGLAAQHFRSVHAPDLFRRGIHDLLTVRTAKSGAIE